MALLLISEVVNHTYPVKNKQMNLLNAKLKKLRTADINHRIVFDQLNVKVVLVR